MSTQQDQSQQAIVAQGAVDFESLSSEKLEAKIARFERLGAKLFGVANCFVSFGNLEARFEVGSKLLSSVAAAFCDSVPFQEGLKVVHDARDDALLANHKFVVGAPYVRFYAAYPLFDSSRNLIGNLIIVDYQVHAFDEQDALLLEDLAVLIEREMTLMNMYQTQLDLIKQNRNLKRDAMIDPTLGTWNKGAIIRSLLLEMDRCKKAEKPLSLVFATWDQNIAIRDKYGIAIADMLMLKVVSRIRSCIRPFDALGRYGNDIFLIVLPGASHLVVTAVAERIRLAILSHPETIADETHTLTISAGVVSTDSFPDADPEEMINLVEKALLSARSAGDNQVAKALP